ncbi:MULTISPECIES: hypothetical protein [unclassified Actinomyces]|uniref:hypothetical protein n=1 Tax=unclassified Actinomyces TaxID=2609248 RepID=UPI000D58F110|nr:MULTISPECIES: hypothetical protein [unclassified Actinomyces]RAX20657.1 hypothetical protein DRB07_13240 [Actinomyces sp. Z3]
MTLVKVNIEDLRSAATSLSGLADSVEDLYDTSASEGRRLYLSTSSLAEVPGYVESLQDESTFLSAKVDWIVLINSDSEGNLPESGEVSYEVDGEDPDTLEEMETALGEAIASLGTDIATSDYEKGDPRLEPLSKYLDTWGGNENVNAALFSSLGPDGTLALTEAVGNHVGLAYGASDSESEMAQKTLAQLKEGLEIATKQWEPDYAQQFGADLVEAAAYPDPDSSYYRLENRNESLTYLLYDTTAGNKFILGTAEKMDELQHEADERGMPSPWNWGTPSRFLPAMINEADEAWALDIPSIIMHDLGGHPYASYEFFSGDDGRVDYWAGQYAYDSGDLSGIAAALDSASTSPYLMRAHKQETASIAARGLEALAGRDDFGVERSQRGVEGAQSLEHILETYMDSLVDTYADSLSRPGGSDLTYDLTTAAGQTIADSPWFSEETLDAVLGVVGRDGQALIDLRTAVNSAELKSVPQGTTRDQLTVIANDWGATEGGIANAIGTGAIDAEKSNDEYAQAWIDLAGKPASELAGLIKTFAPPGTTKGAGWASDALINHLQQEASNTWASNADAETDRQEVIADEAYRSYMRRLLWAADTAGLNGYQDPNSGQELNSDSITSVQEPDGTYRLITPQEYERLSDEDKATADTQLESLAKSADGMGTASANVKTHFDQQFQERYS